MKKAIAKKYEIINGLLTLFDQDGEKIEGAVEYGGSLDLSGTGITALPDNLTVGGSLYLNGCTGLTALPDGLTVGGSLDLSGCTGLTALPDGLTVGGWLDLRGCTGLTALPDGLTVGGSLDLSGTGITALPDNLTVGGSLYLNGCTGLTALPDGLTVGDWLDLNGCTGLTALPDGLTVGGSLYLRGAKIAKSEINKVNKNTAGLNLKISLQIEANFNLKGFSIADGVLGRIISVKKGVKKIKAVGSDKVLYVVTDGERFAHGRSIKIANAELAYKKGERNVDEYRGMSLTTLKSPDDWKIIYREITGSCWEGMDLFAERMGELKSEYTLKEILDVTKGAYQSTVFAEIVRGYE